MRRLGSGVTLNGVYGNDLEVVGLDVAEIRLIRLGALTTDFRGFWGVATSLFISWMKQQFDTEGEFGGERWAELDEDYAAWKSRKYPGKGILQAEGALRQAASRPERIQTPLELRLLVHDEKLQYHQKGNTRGMPARPLLFDELPLEAEAQFELAIDRYAESILRQAGF